MSRLFHNRLFAPLAIAAALAMPFAGAQTALSTSPGRGVRQVDRPKRNRRSDESHRRLVAAEAKRARRRERNGRWASAGGIHYIHT